MWTRFCVLCSINQIIVGELVPFERWYQEANDLFPELDKYFLFNKVMLFYNFNLYRVLLHFEIEATSGTLRGGA